MIVKAFLANELSIALDVFGKSIFKNIDELASKIYNITRDCFNEYDGSKKDFARHVMKDHKEISKLLFSLHGIIWKMIILYQKKI